MEIVRAEKMGFCFGVEKAIELCYKLSNEKIKGKKYILGMLVHNKDVIREMNEIGFQVVTEYDILNATDNLTSDDLIIIRAHGTTKEIINKLLEKNIKIFDASCIFVNKIKELLIRQENIKDEIIFIGDKEHPEVRGIISFGHNVTVFKDLKELQQFSIDSNKSYSLLTQTTLNKKKFLEIKEYLEKSHLNVKIFDRICGATCERQNATKELAKKTDLVIVVGDLESSNSKKLLEVAKSENKNSFLIQNENELDLSLLKNATKIGITAGASTPEKTIKKIENLIRGNLNV